MKESVRFINMTGRECVFKTETNPLNGSQMFWIEPYVSMYAGSKRFVREQINAICKNNRVIKHDKNGLEA